MNTFICLLRGINVSGAKSIKMDALKQLFVESGYTKVITYIQSGNVVFQSNETDIKKIQEKIGTSILEKTGFGVPVLVLKFSELKRIMKNIPFENDRDKNPNSIYFTFLSQQPDKALVEKIEKDLYKPDEFIIQDKIVYLYCPNNYGQTKLSNTFFENKLKVNATTRNQKTVNKLILLAEYQEK